jgi:hypothetical protein
MIKIAGSGSESGSNSKRHKSADPDPVPDPHQNVMDPQNCFEDKVVQAYEEICEAVIIIRQTCQKKY